MHENDAYLGEQARGNTLDALNRLFSAPSEGDLRHQLNRMLYSSADEDSLARTADIADQLLARLPEASDEERGALLYDLGCIALQQDDVNEARIRFSEVLELEPDNAMARHNLAYAHELMADYDEAHREYETVRAQNPEFVLAGLNLALLKLQEGDYEGGLSDLHRMHNADPDNVGLLLYLCRGLLLRGTPADVQEVLDVLERQPDSNAYADLRECRAYALYLMGDAVQAESAFADLLAEDENNLFARMGLIKLLAARNDFESVKPHLERYHEQNPTEATATLLRDLGEL